MKNRVSISSIFYTLILIFSDLFILFLSLQISFYLKVKSFYDLNTTIINLQQYYWILLISLFFLFFEKIYFIRFDFWSDTKRVLKSLFFSFITILTVISLTKFSLDYSRTLIFTFYFISLFLLPISKRYLKKILFKIDFFKERVKIVGLSSLCNELKNELEYNWYFGLIPCKRKYSYVIIISQGIKYERMQRYIKNYSKRTRNIFVIPYMHHLDFSNTNVVDYFNIRLSAFHIENKLLNTKNIIIKYIFEKIVVIFISPFALIIHLIICFLIKKDSRGSILFKQKRLGIKGKKFSCYKYRTMYENGDEILKDYLLKNPKEIEYYSLYHKYKNDPRITRIGRILRITSLDEFPQFFNVLRGDMNLIGPRPYMINEKKKVGKYNEDMILLVKPGITGLWQVSGRNNLTFNERVELDKWYILNWSLWIDFVIFMKTLKVVIGKVGAK